MKTQEHLNSLPLMLTLMPEIGRVARGIRKHDSHLFDQLRRASSSVALNLAEADGNDAGNRRQRLLTALGSARETRAALQVASAWGYVEPAHTNKLDCALDRVCACIWTRIYR